MRIITIISSILISLSISNSNAEGIDFHKNFTWESLLKEAKDRHMYILWIVMLRKGVAHVSK